MLEGNNIIQIGRNLLQYLFIVKDVCDRKNFKELLRLITRSNVWLDRNAAEYAGKDFLV